MALGPIDKILKDLVGLTSLSIRVKLDVWRNINKRKRRVKQNIGQRRFVKANALGVSKTVMVTLKLVVYVEQQVRLRQNNPMRLIVHTSYSIRSNSG